MGTSHLRHEMNLSGPVKSLARAMSGDDLQKILVRDGPLAFAEALRLVGMHHDLAKQLRDVVADAVEAYVRQEG